MLEKREALMKNRDETTIVDFQSKRRQLIGQGYCVLEDMLGLETLQKTRKVALNAVNKLSDEQLAAHRAPGTLINSKAEPGLADCIGNPKALAALGAMGFGSSKFWKAVIISKPGPSPRLYWHQDLIFWDDPRAYSDCSPQIFLMYYLDDTSRENGCLRVLPGTHRQWHDLHTLGEAHTKEINRMENENDPRFLDFPDEMDVPIKAGDLVIGDARMFHATHANSTDQYRTVITVWLFPLFEGLQKSTQSWVHQEFHKDHAEWPMDALEKIKPLIPNCTGTAQKYGFNRQPERSRFGQA